MNDKILACPKCGQALERVNNSLICESRHTYDFSASGYVNFNLKQNVSGDSPDMVHARSRFLDSGYYEAFADEINRILTGLSVKTVVDAGCGEGYYSSLFAKLDKKRFVYGFDLSKTAVNKAAKRVLNKTENALFMVSSIFELPIKSRAVDSVVSIFAPVAWDEFARIIKPGGHLVVCAAGKDHLLGLKKALYEDVYLNTPEKFVPGEKFVEITRQNLKYTVKISDNQGICDLFAMTPYYWKTSKDDTAKLKELNELETELDFDIFVFERSKTE